MPKQDNPNRDAAHAARDARHAAKVWMTEDGTEVNILSHERGMATVRPVGGAEDGSADYQVPKDSLTRPEGDDEAGEAV